MTREGEAFPFLSGHEEHGCHGGCHAGADGGDVAVDVLHGVVDAEAVIDAAAGGVDVDADVLLGVHGVEVEELCLDDVGALARYLRSEEDDTVHHEAREHVHLGDVELALFEDVGIHVVGLRSRGGEGYALCAGVYEPTVIVECVGIHRCVGDGEFMEIISCHILVD
jgi:hypothetical protein